MFRDARLKLNRANKHINEIHETLLALPDRYVSSIETDLKTGGQSIKHDITGGMDDLLVELSLVAGDAIHNLRVSLDYAWNEIFVHLELTTDKYTKFPFPENSKSLDGLLKDRKINTASPKLFECMVTEIKPYPGGNDLLFSLHEIDISNKHIVRVRLAPYGAIEGMLVQKENGELVRGGTWATHDAGPRYVDLHPNVEVKDKGKLSMCVVFDETAALSGGNISDELTTRSIVIGHYLQLIENLLV